MSSVERKKMCANCDGQIPLDAEICPFCAEDQSQAEVEEPSAPTPLFKHQSLEDSLTSLYKPPYSTKSQSNEDSSGKSFAYTRNAGSQDSPAAKSMAQNGIHNNKFATNEVDEEAEGSAQKSAFWSILTLSVGAVLMNLGLLQLFFSNHGVLRLEWKSAYWFVYCLLSFPLFYFGMRKLNHLK